MSYESKQWYRMTYPTYNTGYENDEFYAYGVDGFNELLYSPIGMDVEIYEKRMNIAPKRVRAIIQNRTNDVFNSTAIRQILCNIGTLRCGQYVKYNGDIWMVVTLPGNNGFYEKSLMWLCRHTLHFISPLTGEVVHYPVQDLNSTQYGTGEKENTYINVGDDKHNIFIPYNEETILIDDRFRFIMDKNRKQPTTYRITKVDSTSYAVGDLTHADDGLISWSVAEDQFNPETDSAELMIADYYPIKAGEVTDDKKTCKGKIVLEDLDGDFKLARGESKQISVKIYDHCGKLVEAPTYELEYGFGEVAELISDENGLITIKASRSVKNVGKSIELKVKCEDIGSESTISIQIVNW